jgi:hypothetical protein
VVERCEHDLLDGILHLLALQQLLGTNVCEDEHNLLLAQEVMRFQPGVVKHAINLGLSRLFQLALLGLRFPPVTMLLLVHFRELDECRLRRSHVDQLAENLVVLHLLESGILDQQVIL